MENVRIGSRAPVAALTAVLLCLALPGSVRAADPDGAAMEFLWQANRARANPAAWAQENGLGALLDGFAVQPPLAWNETLTASAQAKAQEFITHGYFAHESPVTGSPNNLIRNVFQYPLAGNTGFYFGPGCDPCVMGGNGNTGVESLAASFGPTGGLFATPIGAVRGLLGEICDAAGTPNSCGTVNHRLHLLGAAALTAAMVDAGAAHTVQVAGMPATTTHYWVFHTGVPVGGAASRPRYLTGAVWSDGDGDGRYDAGEGLAGVTVQAGALQATSNAAGGWSLAVPDATYTVSCAGGGFAGTASASGVAVAGASRAIDCISGRTQAIVDFVPEPDAKLADLGAALVLVAIAGRRLG